MFCSHSRVQTGWWRGMALFELHRKQQAHSVQVSGNILDEILHPTVPAGICHWLLSAEPEALYPMSDQTRKDLCASLYAFQTHAPISSKSPSSLGEVRSRRLLLAWCRGQTGFSAQLCWAQVCWALRHSLTEPGFFSKELRGLGF